MAEVTERGHVWEGGPELGGGGALDLAREGASLDHETGHLKQDHTGKRSRDEQRVQVLRSCTMKKRKLWGHAVDSMLQHARLAGFYPPPQLLQPVGVAWGHAWSVSEFR